MPGPQCSDSGGYSLPAGACRRPIHYSGLKADTEICAGSGRDASEASGLVHENEKKSESANQRMNSLTEYNKRSMHGKPSAFCSRC